MQHFSLTSFAARLPLALPFALVSAAFFSPPLTAVCAVLSPADPAPARVTLQTEDKLSLVATYFAPIDPKQKASAALLVHDSGGSRADLQQLALRLQKAGFAVLTIDLRGLGESASSELNWKQLDSDGQLRNWSAMQRDLKSGLEFLTTQSGVQPTLVSLVAQGSGALLIARHAVRDERVRDLVLIDPKTEFQGSTIVKDLEQLTGLPTLVVVGKSDQNTGKRLAEASAHASSSPEWIEVKVSKQEASAIMTDKAMYGDIAKWMLEKALPPKAKN